MTSFRQFAANRRNALRSTGPKTESGKQQSRLNAVRHGLTAATVIGSLEDAEDYKAFEEAVTPGVFRRATTRPYGGSDLLLCGCPFRPSENPLVPRLITVRIPIGRFPQLKIGFVL